MKFNLKKTGLATALLLASGLAMAEPDAYRIDNSHSFARPVFLKLNFIFFS